MRHRWEPGPPDDQIRERGEVFCAEPPTSVDDNTVVEEFRKGYTLNGRLLRASMVSVAVNSKRGTGD